MSVTAQIDWKELRKQKRVLVVLQTEYEHLFSHTVEDAERAAVLSGVITLMDALQDEAVEAGVEGVYNEMEDILEQMDEMGHLEQGDRLCECGSDMTLLRALDAQGIYLCRGCEKCLPGKLKGYRPEILTGYTQADVNEPIDLEE